MDGRKSRDERGGCETERATRRRRRRRVNDETKRRDERERKNARRFTGSVTRHFLGIISFVSSQPIDPPLILRSSPRMEHHTPRRHTPARASFSPRGSRRTPRAHALVHVDASHLRLRDAHGRCGGRIVGWGGAERVGRGGGFRRRRPRASGRRGRPRVAFPVAVGVGRVRARESRIRARRERPRRRRRGRRRRERRTRRAARQDPPVDPRASPRPRRLPDAPSPRRHVPTPRAPAASRPAAPDAARAKAAVAAQIDASRQTPRRGASHGWRGGVPR